MLAPDWKDKKVPISEGSPITRTERVHETYKNVSQEIIDQLNAKVKAVQIILIGIDNGIYSTVDACPNACEMWKAIERSQQAAIRNRGKAIINSSQPIYDQEPSMVAEDDETSKDKKIDKLMALISLLFKKIYKPTNNNLRTSSNVIRVNQDNSPRINKSVGYENQRIGNVAGARETVEQADWRDDTDDDELEDQELEAHYMYMAQLQEVSPDAADSGPIFDYEPLQKLSNNDHYNVFAIESAHPKQSKSMHDTYLIKQDAQIVIIDSLDMNYDREEIKQNDDNDLAKEREKREKAVVNSPQPIYDQEPSMVDDDDEDTSKEKEIDKLMALISLSFKKIYKPTNNNLRTSSNTNAVDSGPIFDKEPAQKVQNDDHYDVFAIDYQHTDQSESVHNTYLIEQDAQNVLIESEDMNYDSEQIEQNDEDVDLAKEWELLASLIQKLKCTPVVQQSGIQCYNCKEYGHVARKCQKPKWAKDAAYHKEKMLLCKQEEAEFKFNAEQAKWKDDTDDEPEDQELEAHYMYMAKLQKVTLDAVDNSGPIFDTEPLQKVPNNDNYNVFSIESEHPEQSKYVNNTYPNE
nr:hypothetical protein [Tanacetum cinerariifolium]